MRRTQSTPVLALAACVMWAANCGVRALAADANPRLVHSRDAKLGREFEYLVFDLGKGVELQLVKVSAQGRSFRIGSSPQEQDALVKQHFAGKRPDSLDYETAREITLTDDFYLGQFEVTRGQFRRFVEDTGYLTDTERTDGGYGWNEALQKFEGRDRKYHWGNTGIATQTDRHPVTNITQNDARKFCDWLQKRADGRVRVVRLPGEAEWEFACRAGSAGRFSFGDDDERLAEFANVADGTAKGKFPDWKGIQPKDGHVFAAPVGQFQPNGFGLYDMHGNVWEFCEDYYGRYSALPKERNQLQTVVQGEVRPVMRGGAYYTGPAACRAANRYVVGLGGRYASGGFRVLCLQ